MMIARYTFDNAWELAEARLHGLEDMWDDISVRILGRTAIQPGARCLDVGAGSGSITRWLAQQAGRDGYVCSVDIDASFLRSINLPNAEVHQIDITSDDIPAADFDIIHARLVLEHIPHAVDSILAKLKNSLRPGGIIVVADLDTPGPDNIYPQDEVYKSVSTTFLGIAADYGWDVNFGRRLPSLLTGAGFEEVTAEGSVRVLPGGHPALAMMRLSYEQLRGQLTARGHSDEEVTAAIRCLEDPGTTWNSATLIHALGNAPA